MSELVIKIHNYIGESCFNWETGEFEWATNAEDVRMAVEWAEYGGNVVDSICLEIGTCFGGSTFDGREIYTYLQGLGIPIRTRILAFAASMATILMLVGEECEIDASAQILVHGPSGETSGTVQELQSGLKMVSNEHEALRDIYVARTGQPVEVVEEWMSKDTFFKAKEALAAGLVTKIIPIAPKAAPVLTDAQASARRAKYAGITARASQRAIAARNKPTPKTKAAKTATTPRPMAKNVIPISAAARKTAAKKAAAPTAQQAANIAAVKAFAKQMGVKATVEGEVVETTAAVEETVLADDAGTLYTDGPLAVDSAVFNDEALTVATADGDYEAEDGRTITIAGGVVTEIVEAEAEAAAAAAPAALTAAITAALGPITAELQDIRGKVEAFSKAVPGTPRPVASSSQMPDGKTPRPKAKAPHHAGL
jgi:ATP-dependent protease ClpP protease subunit